MPIDLFVEILAVALQEQNQPGVHHLFDRAFWLDTSNLIYILWNMLGAAWAIPISYFVDHASLKGNLLSGAFLNCTGKIIMYAV